MSSWHLRCNKSRCTAVNVRGTGVPLALSKSGPITPIRWAEISKEEGSGSVCVLEGRGRNGKGHSLQGEANQREHHAEPRPTCGRAGWDPPEALFPVKGASLQGRRARSGRLHRLPTRTMPSHPVVGQSVPSRHHVICPTTKTRTNLGIHGARDTRR